MTKNCGILVRSSTGWFADSLIACPNLDVKAISERALGLDGEMNPYGLELVDRGDVAFVCTNWILWIERKGGTAVERAFEALRARFRLVVGIEGYDTFSLGITPRGLDRVDFLLKSQGVYRDRDLCNWEVGPAYPGANWDRKQTRRRDQYTPGQLSKLRLSLPALIGVDPRVRRRVRRFKPGITALQRALRLGGDIVIRAGCSALAAVSPAPSSTAHCVGSLNHIQRMELMIGLRKRGTSGELGISSIPPNIFGTVHLDAPIPEVELASIRRTLDEHDLLRQPVSRPLFVRQMLDHKVVISPTGYGPMCFRCAEAWELGRAVVHQDISNADVMYPFKHMENVILCRPDFSDMPDVIADIESGATDYEAVGRRGQASWRGWIAGLDSIYREGVLKHLDEAMSS